MSIELRERRIPCNELQVGMYVIRPDRPWLETDFLIQGFTIQSEREIDSFVRQCEFVFVEAKVWGESALSISGRRKGKLGLSARLADDENKEGKKGSVRNKADKQKSETSTEFEGKGKKVTYINKISLAKEMPAARDSYASAKAMAKNIMDGIRVGRMIDMKQTKEAVDDVVDSLLRNDSALMFLTKIKDKDEYTAEHSLNVCILTVTFAKHLGHSETEIRELGLCALLHDVGKSKIPVDVINKAGRLTDKELKLMRQHPKFGRDLLMSLPNADRSAIDVAFAHHERIDGKGYPRRLLMHQISYYAKVVALTDVYDAITSNRCYDNGRASMDALDVIFKCRGKQFDEELSIEFIKCIGLYPSGSVVELSNNEVGIILSANSKNKLKPKILLVLDEAKTPQKHRVVDLMKCLGDVNGDPYTVAKELPNGSYGVDIQEFINQGLVFK